MLKHFILIAVGAGLLACSSVNTITVNATNDPVVDQSVSANSIDSLINPYKVDLDAEMEVVIAHAEKDFIKGRPSGSLNNWAAEAVLHSQLRTTEFDAPVFSLLNVGGLRNTINSGDVTLGDIFKVMPFDNELVCVEMPIESLEEIQAYLIKTGGEPIAGAKIVAGKLLIDDQDDQTEKFWIITSDYLLNGGDHMDFFQKRTNVRYPNILLRDAMIEEAKRQKTLFWDDENRIDL
ncbi:MAG: 2',3'-cyclic-nucleotide 2'-phosphodiesterase (5'-nucleotidase family) [Crocinitomicaceae bacterium]|jgi:2',3'-cyclic-nucleotide 2'-phosphodiesterase (5'-nucleotidase family)